MVEWPDRRRDALLFAFEEETEARRFSILRLVHYCADLADLFKTHRVVPVVIFLRGRGSAARRIVLGSDQESYLSFHYLVCDLATMPYRRFLNSDNLVARLNLPNMDYPPQERVAVYAHAVRGLADLESDPDKRRKYLDFIDIYAALEEDELAQYEREFPQENALMSSFAERFRQEGMQQGLEQGRAQGRTQGREQGARLGEARMLARQLELRFGPVSAEVRQRLEQADEATLMRWSERVLSARRLEDVLS